MEPKENCSELEGIEIVLVPTVGITKNGVRLGYGYGYYDRFLASSNAKTISLVYSKQLVKSIPFSEKDVKIDWIVTEENIIETSKFS
jgi:5-formyltetrahydrofolate cyclo-ligase